MGGVIGLGLRGLVARPLRSLLSVIGIALGVGVLCSSLLTSASIDASIERTADRITGHADLRVAAFLETGLGADTLAAIEETPGIEVAAAALERRTFLGPELLGPGDVIPDPVTILAIDPEREPAIRDLVLVEGRPLAGGDDAALLVSATLATQDRLRLGSELVIQGAADRPPLHAAVVGIIAGDGPLLDAGGRTVILALPVAAELFATDRVDRVDILLADGMGVAATVGELEERLLAEPYVVSTRDDVAADLRASTADFEGMTALIAAVALFAGAFLIFNTLSMTVTERFREIGLLRAAGATRGQVMRSVLAQGVVLGSIGSIGGLLFGLALGTAFAGSVGAIGDVPVGGPELTPSAIAGALLAGVVVTAAAAVEPALRAGRISPVEALKPGLQMPLRSGVRLAWVVVVFVAVAGVGLVAWPPAGGTPALVRAVAVYGLLLLLTVLLPLVLPLVGAVAGLPFALVLRLEERLARASLAREPGRAALTIGALAVALAMFVALAGMSQQVRTTAAAWLEEAVPGEVVLTSIRPVPLDEGLGELVAGSAGVARVSPIATFEIALGGVRVDGAAVVGAVLAADGRLRFVAGSRDGALAAIDAGGAAILPRRLADRLGVGLGDGLDALNGNGGTTGLVVAGIVERTLPGRTGEVVLVGWPDALISLGVLGADAFAVRFEPTATTADRAALADDARGLALTPVQTGDIETAIGAALDRMFGLFDGLALVAVIVAALGIVNTLSMSVLERVREIGVLRAAGMTRRQVWWMVVVEAGMCGLAGAALGSLAGVGAAGLVVLLAGGRPDLPAIVPWPSIALALLLGVALAMLAAAWPARVASGLPIVRAVRSE